MEKGQYFVTVVFFLVKDDDEENGVLPFQDSTQTVDAS
jgi:hypothetical protein